MSPKRKRPQIPTWALFAVVAGVLAASAVLFAASYRTSHHHAKPKNTDRGNGVAPSSDDTLVLPKDGGTSTTDTDPAADDRTDLGKNRIDAGTSTNSTQSSTDSPTSTSPTPSAQLAPLRGARIALVPADSDVIPSGKPTLAQRIGTQRVSCGTKATSAASLTRERAVLDALGQSLSAAGASVVRLDDAHGNVPCAAQRSAVFEKNELSIVLATGASASTASVAVAGGALTKADITRSQLFVQSLEDDTGAPAQFKPAGAALANLAAHAVVDKPAGGTVVWLALDKAADSVDPTHLAGSIATAMASTLA